jgi:hypothetical protein
MPVSNLHPDPYSLHRVYQHIHHLESSQAFVPIKLTPGDNSLALAQGNSQHW